MLHAHTENRLSSMFQLAVYVMDGERPYLNPHRDNEILQGKGAAVRFAAAQSLKAAEIESMAYQEPMAYSERDQEHARRAGSPEPFMSKKVAYGGLDDNIEPVYLTGLEQMQQGIDDATIEMGLGITGTTAYEAVPGGDMRRIETHNLGTTQPNTLLGLVHPAVRPYFALGQGPHIPLTQIERLLLQEERAPSPLMRVTRSGHPF